MRKLSYEAFTLLGGCWLVLILSFGIWVKASKKASPTPTVHMAQR